MTSRWRRALTKRNTQRADSNASASATVRAIYALHARARALLRALRGAAARAGSHHLERMSQCGFGRGSRTERSPFPLLHRDGTLLFVFLICFVLRLRIRVLLLLFKRPIYFEV